MPQCANCDSYVSSEYGRVLGDNSGEVHGCPNCGKKYESDGLARVEVER